MGTAPGGEQASAEQRPDLGGETKGGRWAGEVWGARGVGRRRRGAEGLMVATVTVEHGTTATGTD